MAETTDPNVVGIQAVDCPASKPDCHLIWREKWTYAIPLEIVYLTPLHRWNPFNITFKDVISPIEGHIFYEGPFVKAKKVRLKISGAYNGADANHFHLTPSHFYAETAEAAEDDTGMGTYYAFDGGGEIHDIVSSGIYVRLPEIPGIGRLRTRYPIMPLYWEGGSAWKELDAAIDALLSPKLYAKQCEEETGPAFCYRCNEPLTTTVERTREIAHPTLKRREESEKAEAVEEPDKQNVEPWTKSNRKVFGQWKTKPVTGPTTERTQPTLKPREESEKAEAVEEPDKQNVEPWNELTRKPTVRPVIKPETTGNGNHISVHLKWNPTSSNKVYITGTSLPIFGSHRHYVFLTTDQYRSLMVGQYVHIQTQKGNGHVHKMIVSRKGAKILIIRCGSRPTCLDGHGPHLYVVNTKGLPYFSPRQGVPN